MDEKKFIEFYQRHKESGLTIKDFCSNELIAPATFHYWKKKLKDHNRLPGFIPVVVNSTAMPSGRDLPGHSFSSGTTPSDNNASIEIEFANKTKLRISSVPDLVVLKALIQLND